MSEINANPETDPEAIVTKVPLKIYETEIYRLQTELAKLQRWVKSTGARIVVIFEGRDAAGKGGTIKRLTEYLSPRVARVVALPTPTEREKTQWYFQRYIAHLPAAGEIVIFDRSWYNRAGVEKVMGFATAKQVQKFMQQCPTFERMLVEDGIMLRKYWFSVSDQVQYERFARRLHDPLRQWKLSPMDLESISRWEDYSRAKDEMLVHTDTTECPWYQVPSDSKKAARLNMISHFLSTIPYTDVDDGAAPIVLPVRPPSKGYIRPPMDTVRYVPNHAAEVVARAKAGQIPFVAPVGYSGAYSGSGASGSPNPAEPRGEDGSAASNDEDSHHVRPAGNGDSNAKKPKKDKKKKHKD
ncbi:MAG: polyphosphate kinase 2 [Mobiluncus porci]|uniref:polyphosphate kinase 2 n=1 Tax=Mobiluncus porci TaxID=2652278 RepID=UPI0023F26D10|nr:polyphosphate kinase 2 [Mobiluncus porci]MDD7540711.1 polyphosphate kinase 2 [Mobiluncus porci]